MFSSVTGSIELLLGIAFAIVKAWALVDCLRRPKEAFPAVGRFSKVIWTVILGLSFGLGLLTSALGLIGLAGLAAALIYLLDVRQKIKDITGR